MDEFPSAKIIADSISPRGDRLTTMEICFHRFVLSEFNTHRTFSRNSASSRAIPIQKQIEKLKNYPAYPLKWPAEQKGMQGGDSLTNGPISQCYQIWNKSMNMAIEAAEQLKELGVHKSIVNRLLEPFMRHTAIVSSTDFENFFHQRSTNFTDLAQPEIAAVADRMYDALQGSKPQELNYNEWHLPYVDHEDLILCEAKSLDPRHISAARCARVSYLTMDGKRDVSLDEDLYQRLMSADPAHHSPTEHVATPFNPNNHDWGDGPLGNFQGWHQLRHYKEAQ